MTVFTSGTTIPLRNGGIPREGPRACRIMFDILAGEDVRARIDLNREGLSYIQTVFIDNSSNINSVTLVISGAQQDVTCLPRTQGFFPLLCPTDVLDVTCTSAGTVSIPCQFLNIQVPPLVYSAQPSSVTVAGTVPITGNVTSVQSGAWNVGQAGAWSVGALQSGAWAVGQSGAWAVTATGARNAAYGIAGGAPLQAFVGTGRLRTFSVIVAGAAGAIYDAVGVAANQLAVIPAAVGVTNFVGGWPCTAGLYIVPGAGQTLAVSWD